MNRGGSASHPLDPLRGDEIETAVRILRDERLLSDEARIVSVSLHEPPKDLVVGFRDGDPFGREAFVVVVEPDRHVTCEAVVSLESKSTVSFREVAGAHASLAHGEYAQAEQIVRADPRFLAGLTRRGITDPSLVVVESWGLGTFFEAEDPAHRVVWTLSFYRDRPGANPYAKPIHGLHALVDLDDLRVLKVEDLETVPLPPGRGSYTSEEAPGGDGLKPLEIRQPQGPSFEIEGWEVRWQRWRFRIGFNAREGLVLHTVGWEDEGRLRPVVHRASVAELVIPYGDPRPYQGWKNAFDIGEYGIGGIAHSLEAGCDCLGEIRYLDVELADDKGQAYRINRAICLHEEDAGILWKHVDPGSGAVEVRRSRRMVVSFIITAGNYDYAFYWYFYMDGTIELEVKLTGIVLTDALAPGETSDFGTLVAPQTLATHHQHFFSVRLDMAVDGRANSVYEVDTESVPIGPDNPYGNAFRPVRRRLRTEKEAQRSVDPQVGRYWLVVSDTATNGLGQPTGYKLVPGANVSPFAAKEASVTKRAGFMTRHLWVTPYAPSERFPAGEYPNQHPGGAGLPEWTKADRSIERTDLVLWYTMGSHHIPRPEDWPVMPVDRIGFSLKPVGFFDQNPTVRPQEGLP